jgi:hypothetical protein
VNVALFITFGEFILPFDIKESQRFKIHGTVILLLFYVGVKFGVSHRGVPEAERVEGGT